jgi:hypothetical protein
MPNERPAGLQNSGTETQLRQVFSHLHIQSFDEPVCQVCEERLTAGEQITLYLYKPAGTSRYSIGQCRCRTHEKDLPALFTLGVRELIVDGRIGQHQEPTTEETRAVLFTPSVRLISAADTNSGRRPTDQPQRPPHTGDHQHDATIEPTHETDLSGQLTTPTVQPTESRQ